MTITPYQDPQQQTQPYRVRASCGHIVIRRMRPATAGVPYTPETVLDAPNGRACGECERKAELSTRLRRAFLESERQR